MLLKDIVPFPDRFFTPQLSDSNVGCLLATLCGHVGGSRIQRLSTKNGSQLDISGAPGTNQATPGDFGDKQLSKHPTRYVDDPPEDVELRRLTSF